MLLNVKNDSLVVKFSKSQKSFLDIPSAKVSGAWKSLFMQISMVSSKEILVNKASISKLVVQKSQLWVKISKTKVKESLTVNPFCVT